MGRHLCLYVPPLERLIRRKNGLAHTDLPKFEPQDVSIMRLIFLFLFFIQISFLGQAQRRNYFSDTGITLDLNMFSYAKPHDGERFYQEYGFVSTFLPGGSIGVYTPIGLVQASYSRLNTSGAGATLQYRTETKTSEYSSHNFSLGVNVKVINRKRLYVYLPFHAAHTQAHLKADYTRPPYTVYTYDSHIESWGINTGLGFVYALGLNLRLIVESSVFLGKIHYSKYAKKPDLNPKFDGEIAALSGIKLRYHFHSKINPFRVKYKGIFKRKRYR